MKRQLGFTLIELMVVVAIIGILAMIALPVYRTQVEKGRLADAKASLVQDAQFMERFYANNGNYGTASTPTLPATSTEFYDIGYSSIIPKPADGSTYKLAAVPKASFRTSSKFYLTMDNDGEVMKCSGVVEAAAATCNTD